MTTIDIDGEEAADGVMTLVVTVVELLVDALEREAVRRMESGELTDEEIERLGQQLAAIEEEIEQLKRDQEIENGVENLRGDLDGLVSDMIERLEGEPGSGNGTRNRNQPGYSVFGEFGGDER